MGFYAKFGGIRSRLFKVSALQASYTK